MHDAKLALAIHGGAGTIPRRELTPDREAAYRDGLSRALRRGWAVLREEGSAVDAVETAVRQLEDDPLFNAGRGAVFTSAATHEMDACIMSGADLHAGAVAGVGNIKNPVTLARRVMDDGTHVLLCGAGAEEFARAAGIEFATPDYFYDESRHRQLLEARAAGDVRLDHSAEGDDGNRIVEKKFGTVGAVALDWWGNLAAATSTGGMTNKRFGRIGDSPIIGAGTYADNATCAVSCTGHGEYFMRAVAAYDLACLMKYGGLGLAEAASRVVMKTLREMGGEGGLIAVDRRGNIALPFNSEGMYRAWITSGQQETVKIYTD